jgi:outer membrane protein
MRAAVILLSLGFALYGQIPKQLTLAEAERVALRNHPAIGAAEFTAQAFHQRIDQAEAARFPFVTTSLTAAGAPDNSRYAAGALNNPIIYSRVATGFSVNQLLVDFGRTSRLVDSSKYSAQAEEERARMTRADVLVEVDRTYFAALRSETLLKVARQTVDARQLMVDQVSELVKAKLKSSLDQSFAMTNLAEAKLLLSSAENERLAAYANLSQALGFSSTEKIELADESMPPLEPLSITELTENALRKRPDLIAARLDIEAYRSAAAAENLARFPTVSATAGAGLIPTGVKSLSSDYAAVGLNVTLPFLNGGLYKARRNEAELRAKSAERRAKDLENRVARDINLALLDVNNALERMNLTRQFVEQASQSLELAQSRYDLGLSSIVELSQAQLVNTNAEIQAAAARFDYQTRRAVLAYRAGQLQ